MEKLQEVKNFVAIQKGYPNFETMENWIIDNNSTSDAVTLICSAMDDVCIIYANGWNF